MITQIAAAAPHRPRLELDLIADFTCPWSYLGKRNLERALGNLSGLPVSALRWHGFRLTGQAPQLAAPLGSPQSGPAAWREHIAGRLPPGVSVDFAQRNFAEAGRELGIRFDFDRLQRLPDTRDAHRLVKLAEGDGRHNEVVDALFRAFFEEGRDIGDHAVLASLGRDCGLTEATLAAFGDPDRSRADVEAEEKRLLGLGVTAIPNLLINGRILVPGPADVSTYVQALDQALFPELPAPPDKRHLN